jgi:hypothetical protein
MIAQRVSAGFRPPMHSQPREGRQNPCPHERRIRLHHSTTPRNTKRIRGIHAAEISRRGAEPLSRNHTEAVSRGAAEGAERGAAHEPCNLGNRSPNGDWPACLPKLHSPREPVPVLISPPTSSSNKEPTNAASLVRRTSTGTDPRIFCNIPTRHSLAVRVGIGIGIGIESSLMSPRAPLRPETHFHAETPRPPRLEYPSSRLPWMRAEALLKRETKAQESGNNEVAAIHR